MIYECKGIYITLGVYLCGLYKAGTKPNEQINLWLAVQQQTWKLAWLSQRVILYMLHINTFLVLF